MRTIVFASAALAALFALATAASASVVARIDISEQRMTISVAGKQVHDWPISSGRGRYRTPRGTYKPGRMHQRYFSKKYHGAPMPNAIFFYKGYAIHGTTEIKSLGRPASHGCIRLHPDNARKLFSLVNSHGKASTKIVITD